MQVEHTPEGLVVRMRPEGIGRFGSALFLCVWLSFWLLGEVTVLGVLASGGWVLLTGHEFSGSPRTIEPLSALGVGAFLLVWVTIWTFGGVMAIRELLRLISSEDTLVVGPSELTIRQRIGPFRSKRTIPRADVRNVRATPRHRMLVFDTLRKPVEFARVMSPADEQAALSALRKELAFATTGRDQAELPHGWEEAVTPEGDRVLVRDPRARKQQALVLAGVAAVFWAIALALAWTAISQKPVLTPAVVLTVLAALAGVWAYWLEVGRQEIKIGGDRVIVRRRWRGKAKDLFVADRLDLERSTDSDGDVWYKLEAVNTGALDPHPRRFKERRTLASAMNDPFEPTALGRWLAARTGMPYSEP